MKRQKTIAIIGVSDAENAHLRLLMRKSGAKLDHLWEWGDESGADLLVVDTHSFAGQMARTRAHGAGMRYAIFSDEAVADADLVLRRPLTLANVVAVLNRAGNAGMARLAIGTHTDDFYTRDLGEESTHAHERAPAHDAPVTGLDEMLRSQPIELRDEHERPEQWLPSRDRSPDSSFDSAARDAPAPRATAETGATRKYATRESMLADTAPRELRDFLASDLLLMPARYALPGAPPLTLDPKNKLAHAPAGLGALEPYCNARWRLCDWQPLSTQELADIRQTQTAIAYARLLWLDVLVHSHGELARHLDPGGTYRLKHWSEMDKELSRYFRIASALLQPTRLHEVAAAADAPMGDVFDFVNASDAVGLIEWQPRPPREREEPPASLLQRLRHPFKKS